MELRDQIRNFVLENYIKPARARGETSLVVVSGEVHKRMDLTDRMPAVCNALRSEKLWKPYKVCLIREIRLPSVKENSSTNQFVFGIK